MYRKRFAFRVDSSRQIGGGHLMRCLTLAIGLRKQNIKSSFICRKLDGNLNSLVLDEGFDLYELPYPFDSNFNIGDDEPFHSDWRRVHWKTDVSETQEFLNVIEADWLVVDHYGIWQKWQREMRDYVPNIMVIDDLADRAHDCDILLDQNLGSTIEKYSEMVPQRCRTYLFIEREFSAK